MSSTDIITFNCLMAGAGDASTEVLTAEIASNKTVSHLKGKIKELAELRCPVQDIQLFRVSLAPEELNTAALDPHEVEGAVQLSEPLATVSNVFNGLPPPSGRVHVIVLPPRKPSVSFPSLISTDCAETCSWNRFEASGMHDSSLWSMYTNICYSK